MNILSPGISKLDNPVWFSLSETHQKFAMGNENIQCYHPDYCAFGGIAKSEVAEDFMLQYENLTGGFFIVGACPIVHAPLEVSGKLNCVQMIVQQPIYQIYTEEIVHLGQQDLHQVETLVNLVQPGYFKPKTFYLGKYFGIFVSNTLVAITGERMQMDDYTEVTSVVTHPEHTGRGYAKQLVSYTFNQIFEQGKTPFLHVLESNAAAIGLYQKLGFIIRRKMDFWKIELADTMSLT